MAGDVVFKQSPYSYRKCCLPYGILIFLLSMAMINLSCTRISDIQPRMSYPGYRARLIFEASFADAMDDWRMEGTADLSIMDDGALLVEEDSLSQGVFLWIRRDFSGNFQLEYETNILETAGMHILALCARSSSGRDILKSLPPRSGRLQEYIGEQIHSYHISYHCYTPEGEHDPGTKVRKNPGHMLLSRVEPDPCMENRPYQIDILKLGNRILFYVDGILIQDVRDKGGFGAAYTEGKIGFYMHGAGGIFKSTYNNIRVYQLKPL